MARVQQFLVEAKAAGALQHPNIVAIHEVGRHEVWHYISLDYVEGGDLAKILRENVLLVKKGGGLWPSLRMYVFSRAVHSRPSRLSSSGQALVG